MKNISEKKELVDIFDENNNYLGYSLERRVAHEKKLWHRHVSAWIMNYNGKVLLQQRALEKKKNPGKWAKTGGHVDASETCEEAIRREVYEEIGLKVDSDEIENIEIFKSLNPEEHYFSYGYIFYTNLTEDEFKLQKEEVNQVRYYSIEEIEEIRRQNNNDYTFCKWDREGFNKQICLLKKCRKAIKQKMNFNN